jgi:heme exporter protein D
MDGRSQQEQMMNWAEFFSMGGRGFYVWGSYGAFALAIAVEIMMVRARSRRASKLAKESSQ